MSDEDTYRAMQAALRDMYPDEYEADPEALERDTQEAMRAAGWVSGQDDEKGDDDER